MSNFDKEAFERIEHQFSSMNDNPVDRANIRVEDWEAVKRHLEDDSKLSWKADHTVKDYDHSIHTNPDAKAWADLFMRTFPNCGADPEMMHGWFANAMMAMYDHLNNQQSGYGAEPVAHPCWSCGESVSFTERTNNDGDCPHCGVELHTDDWPVRAQDVPEADGWIKCSERLPPAGEWISGQTDTGRVIPAKLIDNGDSTYFRVANDELSEGAIVGWQSLPGAIKRPQPPREQGGE